MKRSTVVLSAIAIAALAAAFVTEISHRVLPGNYVGLLVLTFLACLVTGLAVARVGRREEPARRPRRERRPRARREPREEREPRRERETRGQRETRGEREPLGERESGVVKWFDPTKGFGFIIRDVGGDVFVHRRSIRDDGSGDRELREGARVTFVAVERSRGWRAEEVSTHDE